METTRENSTWQNKTEVKKGNIGERLTKEFLESKGMICQPPMTEGAHGFDMFAYNPKTLEYIAVEVKTKPHRNKYPDTGFDLRSYKRYKEILAKGNFKLLVVFVDEKMKAGYGGLLEDIEKSRDVNGRQYPLIEKSKIGEEIIYFPIKSMGIFFHLSEEVAKKIHTYYKGNY